MEDKVKLNFKKKRKITKKIGDQSFKIKPFISLNEKEYILNVICDSFNSRIESGEDYSYLASGIQADLDMLICAMCTNVDLEGMEYEDIYNSEFIPIVKESIINYRDIEQSCNNMITVLRISSLLPDLNKTAENFDIEKLMEGKSVEEIEEFTKALKDINISKE